MIRGPGLCGLALWALMMFPAHATEVAYVDRSAILAEMPAVKQMRSDLELLRAEGQKESQQLIEAFQTKQTEASQREERGELSPIEKEDILKELQADQARILELERALLERLAKKEQETLKPILERVNSAIEKTAKERGIELLVESSVLIYGDESLDITEAVLAKL